MNPQRILSSLALLLTCSGALASAQIRLPNIFSDHAVLQRDQPIRVWGWAERKEKLTVRFHQQSATTTSDELGRWQLWLKPEQAGGPYTLTVAGSSTVTISDLLVGDVWLASGQSNMEMPLKGFSPSQKVLGGDEEAAAANNPQIRLLLVEHKSSDSPETDFSAKWTLDQPAAATDFSAVAYFFGKELYAHEHVPIGLIDSTWGGTPIESWISLDTISSDASLMPIFAARAKVADRQAASILTAAIEKQEDEEAMKAGKPAPPHSWRPALESWQPSGLFNAMIAPIAGYSLKGTIWYQGETNATPEGTPLYSRLMQTLITDWRNKWQQGGFPFLYVQLSSYGPGEYWGALRDAQRRALALNGTGLAVTYDVGDNVLIHPGDKTTVGKRLALAARAIAYGEAVEFSGPLYRQRSIEDGSIRLWFDHAAGLHAKGKALDGFEIAGADGNFVPAEATIDGNTVLVRAAAVPQPRQVRYGWAPMTPANLYNTAELPAPTFITE